MKHLSAEIKNIIPPHVRSEDIYVLCVGTDRSTGDSFGPLVGDMLRRRGFENVIGTLHDPCHAQNLEEMHDSIPEGKFIIAVDSCLGKSSSIGKVLVRNRALKPGAGVGKKLKLVGNMHVVGVVNIADSGMDYLVLQNTRLSIVMDMADLAARAIKKAVTNRITMAEVAASWEWAE